MWLEHLPCSLTASLKWSTGSFFNARIGSSPGWGAQNVNHFRAFHRGGFFFCASFGPGFG